MNSKSKVEISSESISNVEFLVEMARKLEISGGDASNIILPPTKLGRPAAGKCLGVNGAKGDPCKYNQQYSEETKSLFAAGSKSKCQKCKATYNRELYHKNNKESTRLRRARETLIAHGAQVAQN